MWLSWLSVRLNQRFVYPSLLAASLFDHDAAFRPTQDEWVFDMILSGRHHNCDEFVLDGPCSVKQDWTILYMTSDGYQGGV